jgi:ABC-type glycerol-3-phosphate transport system permease component
MFRFASELSVFSIVPAMPTFDAYGRLLDRPLFFVQLWNTVLSGVVLATLATATSVLAAYPLSRSNLVGRRALFILILGTAFVPLDVVLPPLFFVVRDIGLLDSFWGLVLPFVFSPVSIFLAKQAIDEVPQELEFAAALDGASPLEILRTAVVPNIRSTLLAIWLLNFVFVWEWFLWPVVGMTRDEGQLAQVAITGLLDPLGGNDYAIVFAGAVATVLPAFVVFVLMQRFLVASIISGSGK